MIAMEAAMVAESSGIKDKEKLRSYLYKNPDKLAIKLAQFLKSDDGVLLHPVKIRGKGCSYFYSLNDKMHIYAPRDGEYYMLPWTDEDPERCYVYCHYTWQIGIIFKVFLEDIDFIGFN